MTSTTFNTTTILTCSYCDGGSSYFPYGENETEHCRTCGAEWDPVEEVVETSYCVIHKYRSFDGYGCDHCEDEAEMERLLMEDDME